MFEIEIFVFSPRRCIFVCFLCFSFLKFIQGSRYLKNVKISIIIEFKMTNIGNVNMLFTWNTLHNLLNINLNCYFMYCIKPSTPTAIMLLVQKIRHETSKVGADDLFAGDSITTACAHHNWFGKHTFLHMRLCSLWKIRKTAILLHYLYDVLW